MLSSQQARDFKFQGARFGPGFLRVDRDLWIKAGKLVEVGTEGAVLLIEAGHELLFAKVKELKLDLVNGRVVQK